MPLRLKISIACILSAVCCLLAAPGHSRGAGQQQQPSEESMLRLVSADQAQQTEIGGLSYRIVKGNARFLHNDTYLLCDSAAWNVMAKTIEAFGHVKVIQDETMLTSDEMVYLINENVARFSGPLVELTDKSGNKLRTRRLDYNTKDSTAVFDRGAAMKDKDGNIVESINGTYDSKVKTFTFTDQVNVYMDSIFMKMDELTYLSDEDKAVFGTNTYAWKDNNFVKSDAGYYDRKDSTIQFSQDVYINTPDYETWSEEAFYHRNNEVVELFDNVRILDTADFLVLFGNHARYERDSIRACLTRNPSIIYYGENENHEIDTLFTCADTMIFWATPKCDFSEEELTAAEKHRDDALFDALAELRAKQAAERAQKLEEALMAAGKLPPKPAVDSTAVDSTAADVAADDDAEPDDDSDPAADSTGVAADSTDVVKDTTKIKCFRAYNHVKIFRTDVQACCDSVEFTELDSIAVMFGRPILWNKVNNQLTSETMHLLLKNGNLHRGSMLTDARITSMEDTAHFNQIKSTEMMGFFANNQLYRYDALGGVAAIFYMREDDRISNVNVKQSKSLTAVIDGNTAKRMLYLEEIKSDAYPLAEIEMDKQRLKGFEWRPDERPKSREEVTEMQMPVSVRSEYEDLRKPDYIYANRYFDKYMANVYKSIREAERKRQEERIEQQRIKDSIAAADSLALLAADSLRIADSLAVADSAAVAAATPALNDGQPALNNRDNDTNVDKPELTRAEKRAVRRAERKARREARKAARRASREARHAQRAAGKSVKPEEVPASAIQ